MDTYDFLADPRAIPLPTRRANAGRMQREQKYWFVRVQQLVKPLQLDDDCPAYLLATSHFADLARRLGNATERAALPLAIADELDWFVDAFRDYLRTDAGEDAFALDHRLRA